MTITILMKSGKKTRHWLYYQQRSNLKQINQHMRVNRVQAIKVHGLRHAPVFKRTEITPFKTGLYTGGPWDLSECSNVQV